MTWYQSLKKESDMNAVSKLSLMGISITAMVFILTRSTGITQEEAEDLLRDNPEQAQRLIGQASDSVKEQDVAMTGKTTPEPHPQGTGTVSREEVLEQIAQHEGFQPYSYKDVDTRSIGYGFNLGRKDSKKDIENLGLNYEDIYYGRHPITEEQAILLLNTRVNEAAEIAKRFLPNLEGHPHSVQKVIIDMAYNLGGPRLSQFKKLRSALINKDYQTAANEMIDSKWYGQVGSRSANLVEMMRNTK